MEPLPLKNFLAWLDGFLNFERLPQKNAFWLDTMEFLDRRFGSPSGCAPCVHVAGSKGKGSVCAMAASILEAAGFKAGLYLSPHISDFRERICSPSKFFPDEIYERCAAELVSAFEAVPKEDFPGGRPVTWFELATLYAFLCFRAAKTDWNVLEVGLGGRLDATNVARPAVCCVTRIEMEHTEYLGDTLEKIAAEKAGIIKEGVPVIVAAQKNESVMDVFRRKASAVRAPIVEMDEAARVASREYISGGKRGILMRTKIESPLFKRAVSADMRFLGLAQSCDAAQAVLAVKTAVPSITEEQIERGLSAASLPGRFEIVEGDPRVILDGAHTPRSVEETLRTMGEIFGGERPHLLFACAADKNSVEMARLLASADFGKITLTVPGASKKSDIERTAASFSGAGMDFNRDANFPRAIQSALSAARKSRAPLLVTGSFYLLAEVKKILGYV